MVNKSVSTLYNFIWESTGNIAKTFLQFLVIVLLARLISPADFGVANIVLTLIGLFEIISQAGVGPSIVQHAKIDPSFKTIAHLISIVLGICFGLLFFLASDQISAFFNAELSIYLKVVAPIFAINGAAIVSESLMMRDLQFKKVAVINLQSYVVGYAVTSIILAMLGLGPWALVIGYLVQSLFKAILLLRAQPIIFVSVSDLVKWKTLGYTGLGFTLGRIGNYFATQGDNLAVGKLMGTVVLGIYSRAYQLILLPIKLFGYALDRVLFATMSKKQENKEDLRRMFKESTLLISFVCLPCSIICFLFGDLIILVIFGPEWEAAVTPFQILSAGLLFRTSSKVTDSIIRASGKVYERAWRQWAAAILVIGGTYLGHFYGLTGVAIGVVLSMFINYAMQIHLSLNILSIKLKDVLLIFFHPAKASAIIVLAYIVTHLSVLQIDLGHVNNLILEFFIVLCLLGMFLLLFPRIVVGEANKDLIFSLVRKLKRVK